MATFYLDSKQTLIKHALMIITPDDRILFIGDSITDTGRNREDSKSLGNNGYCALTSGQILTELCAPDLPIFNRGISGNRAIDLLHRVESDVIALGPTVISILIGVNDAATEAGNHLSTSSFETDLTAFLTIIRDKLSTQIILLEPFVATILRPNIRPFLNPKIDVIRKLAVEFGTELIPLDGIFAEASTRAEDKYWLHDGVHPTLAGHTLITDEWLARAEFEV